MTTLMHPSARRMDPVRQREQERSQTTMAFEAGSHGLAQGLGWFSIGLGLAELLTPDVIAKASGVHRPHLLQAYGLREIACGIGILTSARSAGWLWARVAGDALDVATVATADEPGPAALAVVALLGVAALDVVCALQHTENGTPAR